MNSGARVLGPPARRTRSGWVAALFFCLTLAVDGRAKGRDASALACSERHATALGQVACELARALPSGSGSIVVQPARVTSPLPMHGAERFSEKLSALVAAEIGPRARTAETLPAKQRMPQQKSDAARIEISAVLDADRLSATAELLVHPRRFWDRFREGAGRASARVVSSRAMDAELRSVLSPIPLVLTRVDRVLAPPDATLALACDDSNGDGVLEVVSVGRRKIQLGTVVQGRFRLTHSADWSALSEVAPQPLREPIAVASIRAPGIIDIGLTDRAEGVRLDRSLTLMARFPGQLPWPGAGCVQVENRGLAAARAACSTLPLASSAATEILDAVAGARLVRSDGSTFEMFARRRTDARVILDSNRRSVELPDMAGAQLVVADLNSDGRAEVITTANTLDPAADELQVRSISDDGKLSAAFRVPIPGIRAVCVCPRQGPGLSPIIAASDAALWIVR